MTRPRLYDWDEIMRLVNQGLSDYRVARMIGCDMNTVRYVRTRNAPPKWDTHEARMERANDWRARRPKKVKPEPLTRGQVIEAVKAYVEEQEKLPRTRDWGGHGLPPLRVVKQLFGTQRECIEASGYRYIPYMKRHHSGRAPKVTQADVSPCSVPGCHLKGAHIYSDFLANEAVALCRDHYRARLATLGVVVH